MKRGAHMDVNANSAMNAQSLWTGEPAANGTKPGFAHTIRCPHRDYLPRTIIDTQTKMIKRGPGNASTCPTRKTRHEKDIQNETTAAWKSRSTSE